MGSDGVMVDGIAKSAVIVMALAVAFSTISWLALSVVSGHVVAYGVALSTLTGAAIVIPFLDILGPAGGIVVGAVGGFTAFLLHRAAANPRKHKPLAAATVTLAATYLVLLIVAVSAPLSVQIWNVSDGIGSWSGTPGGMEHLAPVGVYGSGNRLALFLTATLSLVATAFVVRRQG